MSLLNSKEQRLAQQQQIQKQVLDAIANKTPLNISGGGTKSFLGNAPTGSALDMADYQGIINYEPSELVITACAGTPMSVIEATLDAHNQMLGFEPPHYGAHATLGGTIACALSGPRRAYSGSVRDFVLGCTLINGKGEILKFGGEVMKNVAGYDVSRLMVGSLGTLGVILEVSLKVLPKPELETTLELNLSVADALEKMHQLALTPLPVSATAYVDGSLYVRLSGSPKNLEVAKGKVGGVAYHDAAFWQQLKEQQHSFFKLEETSKKQQLWRISVPSDAPVIDLAGQWLYEWGGALRWLNTADLVPEAVFAAAQAVGGHARLWRSSKPVHNGLQPLNPILLGLHKQVKKAFDVHGIFNAGRLYSEI